MPPEFWDAARDILRRPWEYPGLAARNPASMRLMATIEGYGWLMTSWTVFLMRTVRGYGGSPGSVAST